MGKIVQLKDLLGSNNLYPRTKTSAVFDDKGTSLADLLNKKADLGESGKVPLSELPVNDNLIDSDQIVLTKTGINSALGYTPLGKDDIKFNYDSGTEKMEVVIGE